jgi:hypothetical protein
MQLLSLLLYSRLQQRKFDEVIDEWQKRRSETDPSTGDADYAVSHVMVAYISSGRAKEGWRALSSFLPEVPQPNDVMLFNAACLASRVGAIPDALLWTARARETKPREEFDKDADFDAARKHPAFEVLLAHDPSRALRLAARMEKGKTVFEIVLRDEELRIGKKTKRFEHRALALHAYFEALKEKKDFKPVVDPNEAPLAKEIVDLLSKKLRAPLGAIVLEHNGDRGSRSHYELIFETYSALGKARTRFNTYVSEDSDTMVSDHHVPLQPIASLESLQRVARIVAASAAYKKLKKRTPVFFVHQEHDARLDFACEIS